jgi:hypothetical protein
MSGAGGVGDRGVGVIGTSVLITMVVALRTVTECILVRRIRRRDRFTEDEESSETVLLPVVGCYIRTRITRSIISTIIGGIDEDGQPRASRWCWKQRQSWSRREQNGAGVAGGRRSRRARLG